MKGATRIVIESRPGEIRAAAMGTDNSPIAFRIEREQNRSIVGALYLGRVAAVRPSMGAAFIDLGLGVDGYLNIKPDSKDARGVRIAEGAAILVRVTRDAEADKGPMLDAAVDIAGRAMVLTPGKPGLGLSSRISDPDRRQQLISLFEGKDFTGAGLVLRTACESMSSADILSDFEALSARWQTMIEKLSGQTAPVLVEPAPGLVERMVLAYVNASTREIMVDDAESQAWLNTQVVQSGANPTAIVSAPARVGAFEAAGLSDAFEAALSPVVPLPGGGTLIITETPAMTTIDVNAGRGAAGDPQRLAYETNAEAAVVLAHQLRLRGIGGLIAVDFLKLREEANQQKILSILKANFRSDRAGARVGAFSPFGIVDIVRRADFPSLSETMLTRNTTRTPETVALDALARIQRSGGTSATITVAQPVAAALAGPLAEIRKTLETALGFVIRIEQAPAGDIETVEIEQ